MGAPGSGWQAMIQLRNYQAKAIADMRAALREHDSILFRGPTGCGKTVIASYMAQQSAARNRKVIFGVHRIELATQTAKTFDQFGIKYGFIAAGFGYNPFAMVQIASADTLRNRPELIKGCRLFVPDEAHLWASKTRAGLIQSAREEGAKVVGLSATPQRLDGKPLSMFDVIVEGPSEASLIASGNLSEYRAFAPSRPDLSGLHTRAGDYVVGELEERFDKPAIHGDAIESWRKYASGKRTMVFAISRQHGQHVTDAYNQAGIPAVYIDGTTPHGERRDRIERFADGRALILVSIALCIEGFDLSAQVGRDVPVESVQLLNPTKSLPRARQMMGRALRPKPEPAIILDHVGIIMNADGTVNHGFPDDEREWSLAGRESRAQDGAPSFAISNCANCFGAYKTSLPRCPHCSSDRVVKPRLIEEREGELEEIQRTEQKRQETRKARDLESVSRVAVDRGYKPGWVAQRLKHIGARPVSFSEIHAAMMQARQEVAA